MKREFSRHTVEKYSYIKFHENTSRWRRGVQCVKMHGQTERDMAKLTVAFHYFANAPKTQNISVEHDLYLLQTPAEMWWHTVTHGRGSEGGNWRMEWVASTLHTTSEHGVSSITTADAHTSAASSRLNWRSPPI